MEESNSFELRTFSVSEQLQTLVSLTTPENSSIVPAAPPSPLFDGINEHINIEPFPELDAMSLAEGTSSAPDHCVVHCDKNVCMRLRLTRRAFRPCTCPAVAPPPLPRPEPSTTQSSRPSLTFRPLSKSREDLQALVRSKNRSTEIEIHLDEVQAQLQHLEMETLALALRNVAFMEAMRDAFSDHDITIAVRTVQQFFHEMNLYFARTIQQSGTRTIALGQLCQELDVYRWTMLRDWVERYGTEDECERILPFYGMQCVYRADSGALGAVSTLGFILSTF